MRQLVEMGDVDVDLSQWVLATELEHVEGVDEDVGELDHVGVMRLATERVGWLRECVSRTR